MNRRASCVGTFEVFEAAHVALRTLLAFSQPVNCIFWPIGMLNWLVAASKLHKHRETCCTAEWPFYSFLILCCGLLSLSPKGLRFLLLAECECRSVWLHVSSTKRFRARWSNPRPPWMLYQMPHHIKFS